MSRRNRWVMLGLWLSLGCSQVPEPPGKSLQSKLERITTAPAPDVLSATIEGNTSAALEQYGRLLEGDENLFFSPHSISSVLGLTFGGAGGTTKTELETVLHAPTRG